VSGFQKQFWVATKTFWPLLFVILISGFLLRVWLAFFAFPNQGFAWDMATFANWIDVIRAYGLDAYAAKPSINYPPVFAEILVVLIWIADLTSIPAIDLIKWPSIFADLGIALVLASYGRKWFGTNQALIAAGMYLFVPVTWYNTSIWGQVDSLSALPMLLAVCLLIDRKPEWSAAMLMVATLIKPQGALVILILLPVFIGQLVKKHYPAWRSLTTVGSAMATFALLAMPWSMERYAPVEISEIFFVGDAVGLLGQYLYTAGLFPVLTANAFNIWAAVGKIPLAAQIQNDRVYWIQDDFSVFGAPSGVLGLVGFFVVVILIFIKLARNQDPRVVLLGYATLLFAFFALPTRVHERYLVQAFTVLVVVWGSGYLHRALLWVLAIANTVNLHAILAKNLAVETIGLRYAEAPDIEIAPVTLPDIKQMSPEGYGLGWVRLPTDFARLETTVWLVIAVHTILFFVLLVQFLRSKEKLSQEV
jgi:Gpi18-like mannosyltransferase